MLVSGAWPILCRGVTMDEQTDVPHILDLRGDELEVLFRAEARRRVAAQLGSGEPVYSSGIGPEADHLLVRTPDGRLRRYRVQSDGQRLISDDVA